ncbi:DNA polymerase ligase N-terminal domain-containing protein [Candidatus Mycolicibacterium alkanivorans]|uniref:DNA ligase n=1 Tax=Candidatus Mycolicibacterium alkanivorans TaxID=2954114 RepID=A0ABS9YSD5_9MYCO|nr:DNA polymerase ligase N-terminal domain-containing protein [Candidatus Mycolicibacterium alkanivorans]MCI4674143.1 DNA ligase [Candidatus Mycolicibacterium alkanivorans]
MRSDPSADRRPGVTSAGNGEASRPNLQLPGWRRRHQPPHAPHFVIQHHAATSDHYDFRLAVGDVLVSGAVPKGPSTNPKDKRMARRTEDHPLDYEWFEGTIPEGQYGAGRVIVWDRGTYINESRYDMSEGLQRGHLSFWLDGQKLRGGYALARIRDGADETWLLVKKSDEYADARSSPVRSQPESVLSGRALADLS